MTRRVPARLPDQLTPQQRAVYDRIAGGPRAAGPALFEMVDPQGRLNGPFDAMLTSPGVGDALQALGAAVRYGSGISDRIREMAILAVATHWDSAFERYAHEPIGRAAGLTEAEVAGLRTLPAPVPPDSTEAAALDLVQALCVDGDVDDATYARVAESLSEAAVFELTTLVGYYTTLALIMRAFRVGLPASADARAASSVDS